VNIPGEVSQSIASSSGSLLLLSFLQKTHEYHTSKTTSTSTTVLRTGYPPLTRRTLRMSSTYRQVEESRAASRVGSRAGSPSPGSCQGGRGGGRLRLVEERIEELERSAGTTGDVNEQVFRELKRRGNGRAEKLGTVWLDGVSVSLRGGVRKDCTAAYERHFRNPLRIAQRLHRPCQSPHSSCHTRYGPVRLHATTSFRRLVRSPPVAYG
jgi:hypothetical protein